MLVRKKSILAAATIGALAIFAAQPALACVPEPPWVPALPNETEQEHSERREQALADRGVIWELNRQESLVERAGNAFLGEVLEDAVTPDDHRVATVRPLLPIKGTLPAQPVRLETHSVPGCTPFPAIDGEGALAKKGDLVFVFTGLEPHPVLRPRGIDSLMTGRILDETLVRALKRHGLEDRGE